MESAATAHTRVAGRTIAGKYVLQRELGSGGMGAVYEALNTWTSRRVALKILHPEHSQKRDAVQRFMLEAKAATQIAHPNICDVLDMGEDPADGSLYIVQEFLEGQDLRDLLDQRGRLTPREALDVAIPVMGALAAAHKRGIVHRDIKPENIFLNQSPTGDIVPKLIDFGVSKVVDQAIDHSVTQTGTAVGTPNYMSPEQARGDADLDGQTDVWSMGVLLYEMLSGHIPFDAPNYNLLIVKIITGTPEPIEHYAPELPKALADAVRRALSPERSARFPSMRAMLVALLDGPLGDGGPSLRTQHRGALAGFAELTGTLAAWSSDSSESPTLPPNSLRPIALDAADADAISVDDDALEIVPIEPAVAATPASWSEPAPKNALAPRDLLTRGLLIVALVCVTLTVGIWVGRSRTHGTPPQASATTVRVIRVHEATGPVTEQPSESAPQPTSVAPSVPEPESPAVSEPLHVQTHPVPPVRRPGTLTRPRVPGRNQPARSGNGAIILNP